LAITNDVVASKDVCVFDSDDFKDGTVGGTDALVCRSRQHVTLIRPDELVFDIDGEPAVCLDALKHEAVARADLAISRVGPGHLFVG